MYNYFLDPYVKCRCPYWKAVTGLIRNWVPSKRQLKLDSGIIPVVLKYPVS
jgi:hypothetical protein